MSMMGHKSSETTSIYYHVSNKRLQKVVKRDPLSRSSLSPAEIFKLIKESIEALGIIENPMYKVSLIQNPSDMEIKIRGPGYPIRDTPAHQTARSKD